jgi:glycosyltransferase involved in cell wall biosynthesis
VEQLAYRAAALGPLAGRAERWLLTRASGVLVVSSALREYALGLGVEPGRIHVIPNAVDPELFAPAPAEPGLRARWGLGDGPILGFVGGLRPWHGVEILPGLLARLAPRHPGVRLVFVGQGPLQGPLECELRARGLGPAAVFTGNLPQAQVAGLLRLFDLALAPYPRLAHDFYFSPLKLFEYLASGTAVVASKLGQIAEVLRDGETGLLYPPGDLDGLFEACERLLADPGLRRRLGAAGAAEVHQRYTWERNAERVGQVAALVRSQPEVLR